MDNYQFISSLQNPKVKQAIHLRDRRTRDNNQQFIIEGYRELLRAVDAEQPIDSLFLCKELFLGENEEKLIHRIQQAQVSIFECTEKVFRKISYRDRPDGLLAIAPQIHRTLDDLTITSDHPPFFVIAEAVEKPGNLGSILRSSDASGVDALVVADRCTDIHNPNVIRSSVGTFFSVPVIEANSSEILNYMQTHQIKVVASTPNAEQSYVNADLTGPIVICVGTEQYGLSDHWLNHADVKVRIPMLGIADSLNVATATTLLLYEVVRQRSGL